VSIIEGETGCGKSSRVPLMLLRSVPGCRMFISQPRRIAASSLKDRVCSTDPDLARFFGLRLGHGHRSETPSTRVWFCTTGYLVRLLAHHPDAFRSHTHLVIDEVHERSVDTDILCLLTRRLLHTNPRIKLVLMSATLSSALYQSYFQVEMPPVQVKVRLHPIEIAFADEFDRGGGLVSLMDQHGGRQGGAGTPATDNRVRKEQ
jgi:HrpA-like RNA helicase